MNQQIFEDNYGTGHWLSLSMRVNRLLGFVSLAFIASCAAPEVLEPRNSLVPANVDLSGLWTIRNDESDGQRRLREAIRNTDGVKDSDYARPQNPRRTQGRRQQQNRVKGGLVYVFLETGRSLKVTQTAYGLFISFDRSVVEEFRFGEDRIVSVGAVEAQRVTGWEGDELVVESLDRNNMKLTERFRLLDRGQTLQRQITLRSKAGEEETLIQLFDKTQG